MIILGKVEIDNGIRIKTNNDICLYYQWLIKKYFYNLVKIQTPTHGAHVTLYNPKIHKNISIVNALKYDKMIVEFEIFPEKIYRSPKNYWIPVACEIGDKIKHEINIDDGPNYLGLHLTVANTKFN